MKITYINHSGFIIELENCCLIFDYYNGTIPETVQTKPVIVFSSHFHQDHYNKEIFDILKQRGLSYQAVLAKDIKSENYPENTKVTKVYANKEYELDFNLKLKTLLSTDSGVAFILETSEGKIYHAGDLNDWHWDGEDERLNKQMTGCYRAEINKIKDNTIKAAFVPLDPRQEKHYADGMIYFLKNTKCENVFPMHYWGKPEIINTFLNEYPEYKSIIKNTETVKGDMI